MVVTNYAYIWYYCEYIRIAVILQKTIEYSFWQISVNFLNSNIFTVIRNIHSNVWVMTPILLWHKHSQITKSKCKGTLGSSDHVAQPNSTSHVGPPLKFSSFFLIIWTLHIPQILSFQYLASPKILLPTF
jgi:hypothetical protein